MASVHSGESIRNEAQARKKVFKNVLDSPFTMKWPAIPNDLSQTIVDHLVSILSPIGDHRRLIHKTKDKQKKKELQTQYPEIHQKQRIQTGMNTVTRLLEEIIDNNNNNNNNNSKDNDDNGSGKWIVFVCKRDIQPTQLCNHFLPMCSMARVKLVSLPEGAEVKLSGALALTRVAVVALKIALTTTENKEEEQLRLAVDDVQNNHPEWLDHLQSKGTAATYRPTNVKVLQTTAPTRPPKSKQQQQPKQQQQQSKQQQQKRNVPDQDNSKGSGSDQPSKRMKR